MTTAPSDETVAADPTGSRRHGGYWLPVVLIVGLLLGAAIGYLIPRTTAATTPGDSSPEAGFARDMSTHHAQAVEMGMIAFERGSHRDVRIMARDIALTQQGQIGMMQSWLQQWKLDPTGSSAPMAWMPDAAGSVRNGLMPGMATPAEIQKLRTATGKAEDSLFLQLMVQHHLGGIHMAQEIVQVSDDEQVKDMAQIAIDSQQRELTDMRSLQQQVEQGS